MFQVQSWSSISNLGNLKANLWMVLSGSDVRLPEVGEIYQNHRYVPKRSEIAIKVFLEVVDEFLGSVSFEVPLAVMVKSEQEARERGESIFRESLRLFAQAFDVRPYLAVEESVSGQGIVWALPLASKDLTEEELREKFVSSFR